MIKQLKQSDVSLAPFAATKAWELYNIENDNVVLLEPMSASVSIPDTYLTLDYVDYNLGPTPTWNDYCNVALEQQENDQIIFEEGISGSKGEFDPNGPQNVSTGTYKVLLYTQIANAFYNNYHNPTQIFGMENIDFPLNRTNRYLANYFRMFSVPRRFFGEKLVEGSIRFYDTNFDDNVDIYDDRVGNLIASQNLFSKVQEVRSLGNIVVPGDVTASFECPQVTGIPPMGMPIVTAIQTGTPASSPYVTATQL